MRKTPFVVATGLLVLLVGLGTATSLRLTGGKGTLGHEVDAAALVVALVSPAYLLLAVALFDVGLDARRGLRVDQAVVGALTVSSLVVVGVSLWLLIVIVTSRSSTASIGLFIVPIVTLVACVVSFVVTWALMRIIERRSRGAR